MKKKDAASVAQTMDAELVIQWITSEIDHLRKQLPAYNLHITIAGSRAIESIERLQRLITANQSLSVAIQSTQEPVGEDTATNVAEPPKTKPRHTRRPRTDLPAPETDPPVPEPRQPGRRKRLTEERKDEMRLRLVRALAESEHVYHEVCMQLQEEYGPRQLPLRALRGYVAGIRNTKAGTAFAVRILTATEPEQRPALAELLASQIRGGNTQQLLVDASENTPVTEE
ncbi:hypothetical protein HY632_05360 [Candidatus Uhrbacteria bacterium]|nr:hypothetical protein [Candidatus Uhrbacteria bacterium]